MTQYLSVNENTSLNVTSNLPCSPDESFEYNLWSTWASTAPSWIQFDNNSLILTINAPNVDSDQEFDFYILSGPVGTKIFYQTLIKLTVVNCKIQNCLQCSTSLLTWEKCQNGFLLVNDSWSSQNTTVRTPYLMDGHLHLTDGHPTWRMNILFSWIVYMSNIFSFKSNTSYQRSLYFQLFNHYHMYFFRKRRRLLCILKYNQRFFMNLFRTKRILSWIRYQYGPTIKDFTIVVVGFSKTNSKF